jgi:hypothetical protein
MNSIFFALLATLSGSWQIHPAFYPQVDRIIDTERFAYIHAHQEIFDKTSQSWSVNHSTIFRFDKLDPANGFIPLPAIQQRMPITVRVATYSPAIRSLITAGENGDIWIHPDHADPYPIYGLDNISLRGVNKINSLTLSPADNRIWVGATYGFASINPDTHSVTSPIPTDSPIDWIAPVGDHLIAFANSTAYEITLTGDSQAEMQPLNLHISDAPEYLVSDAGLANPASLMPLTDKTFAFLAARPDGSRGYTLNTATLHDGEWHLLTVLNQEITFLEDRYSVTFPTYKNATPNRDGYYIYSENDAYQLITGIDPDFTSADPAADFSGRAIRTTRKTSDSWRPSGSWDLSDFTFFKSWDGIYTRHLNDGTWSDISKVYLPSAPHTFMPSAMTWHPDYGMLLGAHGADQFGASFSGTAPLWVNVLSADGWYDLSPTYHTPEEVASSAGYASYKKVYPLSSPKGLAVDPNDPDHVFAASTTSGWGRVSLGTPEEIPLHAGNANDRCRAIPGFIEAYPEMSAWNMLCNFSAPSFDNEGRLWMLFNNTNRSGSGDYNAELHYYTPDDLKQIRRANTDPGSFITTRVLPVPMRTPLSNYQLSLALRHTDNRNLIALASGGFGQPVYLLDHNGTPDDPSDDRIATLDALTDPTGGKVTKDYIYTLYENPFTGDLWIGTYNGIIVARPSEVFDNENSVYRPGAMRKDERDVLRTLQSVGVSAVTTGPDGCIWIGTYGRGVICLTPDGNTIAGELTAAATPLPDDHIYNLAWHPGRNSLLISTFSGIAEFHPSTAGTTGNGEVTVTPRNLNPDYMGYITVSGLQPDAAILITGPGGETAATLTASPAGKVQWEPTRSGRRLPGGVYTIRSAADGRSLATLRIID